MTSNNEIITDKDIEKAIDEAVQKGYMRKLPQGYYKLTNKGKGYCECLIVQAEKKESEVEN